MADESMVGHWVPEDTPQGLMDGNNWVVRAGDQVYCHALPIPLPEGGQRLKFSFCMPSLELLLRFLERQRASVNDLCLLWTRQNEGAADSVTMNYWAPDGTFDPEIEVRLPWLQAYNARFWYDEICQTFTGAARVRQDIALGIIDGAKPEQVEAREAVAQAAVARHLLDCVPLMGAHHRRVITDFFFSPEGIQDIKREVARMGPSYETPPSAIGGNGQGPSAAPGGTSQTPPSAL